ncbi:FA5-like protein [Mya arenaria]|uniref:FA5-like protein n=1 Tax=Mya arenaria TaxID=6604 RepID=A0ABY7F8S8_MYAAR|nr:FA5-like protein [Mya arenaria]
MELQCVNIDMVLQGVDIDMGLHGVDIDVGLEGIDIDMGLNGVNIDMGVIIDMGLQGFNIDVGLQGVDIDMGLQGVDIDMGLHSVDIDMGLQGVDIDMGLQGVDIDMGLHSVDIDMGLQGVDIDMGLHSVDIDMGLQSVIIDMGLQGINIDVGLQGVDIDMGLQGVDIDMGLQGVDIDMGLHGVDIDMGLQSISIIMGLQGVDIDMGLQGVDIDMGLPGVDIDMGLQSINIDMGLQGVDIDMGLQGVDIDMGLNGVDIDIGVSTTTLQLNVTCISLRYLLNITVVPVNEFKPTFLHAPFAVNVTENNMVGDEVFRLCGRVKDMDYGIQGIVKEFRSWPHLIQLLDGREFFNVDSTTGAVTCRRVFDYESLQRNSFLLNVSAKGRLDIKPGPVFARDGDITFNNEVTYALTSDVVFDNLQLDSVLGNVSVTEPFLNATNLTYFTDGLYVIDLNVTATEVSSIKQQTTAVLSLLIYLEYPTSLPPTSEIPNMSSSNVTVTEPIEDANNQPVFFIEIIVPVVIVVVSVIILIIVFVRRRRQKTLESVYDVKKKERNRASLAHSSDFKIESISKSPINPYEMISVYAKLSPPTFSGNVEDNAYEHLASSKISSYTLSTTDHLKDVHVSSALNDLNADVAVDAQDRLYAKVDKRKQRKRAVVNVDAKTDAEVDGEKEERRSSTSSENNDVPFKECDQPYGIDVSGANAYNKAEPGSGFTLKSHEQMDKNGDDIIEYCDNGDESRYSMAEIEGIY